MSSLFDILLSGFLGTPTILSPSIEDFPIEEPIPSEMMISPEELDLQELFEISEPLPLDEFIPPTFPIDDNIFEFTDEEISLEQLDQEQTEFLNSFEKAVTSGSKQDTLDHIDWLYKEDQLEALLEGNEDQFLDELFCGQITIIDQFKCLPFQEVEKVKDFDREVINPNGFYLTEIDFLISDGITKITQQMDLYRDDNNPKLYGIYGSEG